MKVLAILFAVFCCAFADVSLTGRFATGTGSFFPPNTAVPCAATTTSTFYKVFNNTFTTAGVRTIQLLASGTKPIYIYRGSFDATAPCTNAQTVSTTSSGSTVYRYEDSNLDNTQTLQISFAFEFAADTYFFVVTASSVGDLPAATYSFGVRVIEPVSSATTPLYTAGSTNVWQAPYTDSSSTTEFRGNDTYVSFTYTATTTDRYDIGAFAANATASYNQDVSLGIFTGTPTNDQIFQSTSGIFPNDNNDENGVWVFFVPLTAGQTYTFVASRANSEYETSNIGFFVVPSSAHRLIAGSTVTNIFSEPAAYSATSACTSRGTSYVGLPYTTASFNVLGNIVVAKSSDGDSYNSYLGADLQISGLDWYTYLYRGNNTQSPAGCPVTPGITYVSSTDDGTIYNPSASAAVHTLVVSTYSSSPSIVATSGIVIFYFAGPTIGESVSVPTGAPTPAPPTTSSPTTSSPTTSTPTTSSPTTSSGSTIVYIVTIDLNTTGACASPIAQQVVSDLNAGYGAGTFSCVNSTTTSHAIISGRVSVTNGASAAAVQAQALGYANVALAGTGVTASVDVTAAPTPAPSSAPSASTTSGAASVAASIFVVALSFALML